MKATAALTHILDSQKQRDTHKAPKTVTITRKQAVALNLTSTRPGVARCKPRVDTYNPRGAGSYSVVKSRAINL